MKTIQSFFSKLEILIEKGGIWVLNSRSLDRRAIYINDFDRKKILLF